MTITNSAIQFVASMTMHKHGLPGEPSMDACQECKSRYFELYSQVSVVTREIQILNQNGSDRLVVIPFHRT